uniref:Uncharacterized protein n=1 Tax=viral metagenome TaxID=1070528 RepID=A0A6M3JC16_9ZZZZ
MTEPRIYGQWAGNEKGVPENIRRCIEEVCNQYIFYQCKRLRGHGPDGLYCKQHAKRYEVKP